VAHAARIHGPRYANPVAGAIADPAVMDAAADGHDSGGDWRGAYGMGHATATSSLGPFARAPENPILRETAAVRSPGGGSLARGPAGGDWLVYHGRAGARDQPRTLRIDAVLWGPEGTVRIAGPADGPQPAAP